VIAHATHELSDGIELEYLELRCADTLLPVERIDGRVIALVAARVGGVRLIDNVELAGANSIARSRAIAEEPGPHPRGTGGDCLGELATAQTQNRS
jgi:hypothetical protein